MTRRRSIPCLLVGFALSLAAIPAAYAQSATAPARPKDGMDKADVYFRGGNEHFKQQRRPEAETAYELALGLKKAHDIAANLGYAEARLGKLREAAEHLAFAVRTWPPTGKEDKRQFAVDRLALLKKELGTVTVQVNVARAEVFADGRFVGLSPLESEVFVDPGTRVIDAKMFGYESARQAIRAERGSAHTVKLELSASPPATSAASTDGPARLAAASSPPIAKPTMNDKGGSTSSPGIRPLVIGGLVSAGAFIGAGVVFLALSSSHASDADEQGMALFQEGGGRACKEPTSLAAKCAEHESSLRAERTFRNLSLWSFVTGGVLGAGTVVYAVAAPASKTTSSVKVLPIAAARGGGLVIAGRW